MAGFVNGGLQKILLWMVVSLLTWNVWQTEKNSEEIAKIATRQQDLITFVRDEDHDIKDLRSYLRGNK